MFHLTRTIITQSSLLMRNSLQCNDDCLPLLKIQWIALWDRLLCHETMGHNVQQFVENYFWQKKQLIPIKFIPFVLTWRYALLITLLNSDCISNLHKLGSIVGIVKHESQWVGVMYLQICICLFAVSLFYKSTKKIILFRSSWSKTGFLIVILNVN